MKATETQLKKLNFPTKEVLVLELDKYGVKFYYVGGCVRDIFLGKNSKDIDIIVPHIEYNDLINILSGYGEIMEVGEVFPIIKYKPNGSNMVIDVALPRLEKTNGEGHKDFDVIFDKSITLEDDLGRRDFTMNALAMDTDGNIIDLFGGINDIENKLIRIISEKSFEDDPLRILRAIQFSSRFLFTLENETSESIEKHKHKLTSLVSPERIREEIEKGLMGSASALYLYLVKLFDGVITSNYNINIGELVYVEFIHYLLLSTDLEIDLNIFYFTKMETEYFKQLEKVCNNDIDSIAIYEAGLKSWNIIDRNYLKQLIDDEEIDEVFRKYRLGIYCRRVTELAVNGNDIMTMGISGAKIGVILNNVIRAVNRGEILNERNTIVKYIKNNLITSL